MHVVATAGHVDHGKSTLVRALTGMEPDRWAEEQRRGMTIDLGFAWTTWSTGDDLAFVDVPGHERFVTNMLAGVGPAPALLLVVAADEGWMPQTEEHARAVAALPCPRVGLVVTKCDLAPAEPVLADATRRLASLGLEPVGAARVAAPAGAGLDDVRAAIGALVAALPAPDPSAPVRLWIDRAFTIRGAGTVVTGTLAAGTIRVGDTLQLSPGGRDVVVRGLQSLQQDREAVAAVARVAVNLRGVNRDDVRRGMSLLTPGAWTQSSEIDVVIHEAPPGAQEINAHIGAAAVPARVRPLGPGALRLRLATPVPLHLGDRLLLRDPVTRRVVAADVADLQPRAVRRRGDAARIGAALSVPRTADDYVARHVSCSADALLSAGLYDEPQHARRVGHSWVSATRWAAWRSQLVDEVRRSDSGGLPIAALARTLGAPSEEVVLALAADEPSLECADGRVRPRHADFRPVVPEELNRRLGERLFDPLDPVELERLGCTATDLARAARQGLVLKLTRDIVLAAEAPDRAVETLRTLPQPFTVSAARQALGSTRRIVVPLLEHLDATRRTQRHPDGTRTVVDRGAK